jgi:chaperonin GroEL (HSP60 family)
MSLGRDKLIVRETGEIVITNDGAKLLKELNIEHPIGQLLVNLSQSQDESMGDGNKFSSLFPNCKKVRQVLS